MNKAYMNKFFKSENLEFDSTSLNATVPIIEKKLGKHKKLFGTLGFKDIAVEIG